MHVLLSPSLNVTPSKPASLQSSRRVLLSRTCRCIRMQRVGLARLHRGWRISERPLLAYSLRHCGVNEEQGDTDYLKRLGAFASECERLCECMCVCVRSLAWPASGRGMACQDCGFRRGAATPFGVRSYLDHFYQGCRSEPDEETLLRPGGRRGAQEAAGASTACKAWFACGLLGMLTGAAVMLASYLAPARLEAVGNGGGGGGPGSVSDVLLVDPSAARFNRLVEGCKLAGALLFAAGGAALSGSLLVAAAAARGRGGDDDDGGEVMTTEHQHHHEQQDDEEVVQENRLLLHEVRSVASGAVPKSG
ncbi:unnamed protein product [Lampetra fluviatilis]